ncbi:MAG: mechanosensitive ion channel family protein [Bacteroidia bacterium]
MITYIYTITIVVGTVLLAFITNRFMSRYIAKIKADSDSDPTTFQFMRRILLIGIYLVGISLAIYTVPDLRNVAQSMLAGAGIAAVAIGFASQAALSNIVAGIFIVIFKPFRIHDRIVVKDTITGIVEDITLRHTVIRNFENRRVVIPNSIVSAEVIINSDLIETKVCRWVDVGIGYGADIDLAKSIMAEEIANHPLSIDNRSEEDKLEGVPRVPVRVMSLGDFSVGLRAWAWAVDSADGFAMHCDILESIKKRFDAEGVEIPFPYRNVVMKS